MRMKTYYLQVCRSRGFCSARLQGILSREESIPVLWDIEDTIGESIRRSLSQRRMGILYQSFSSEVNQRCGIPTGLKVSSLEKNGRLDARIANDGEREAVDTDNGLLDSDTRGCKERG